ncbi:MAG TPA: MBL fold metallo-hydrolase [Alphaproteobacteria bacterium]|nr:MBL fold metallo-hydrolase [Alphaproteobacteria bacterium]
MLETVSPLVRRVVARNPSPFTFKGTATFIVGHGRVAVIDPGPDLPEHIAALLHALRGESVERILITHTHRDHSPAAEAVKAATGAATYGFGPHGAGRGPAVEEGGDFAFVPDVRLADGDALAGPGWHLSAVHTPGHTSNHLCFALAEERILFSGDHVMGWSTSVISPPDGDMATYMRSLEKLLARDDALYMPTHGPAIPDPKAHVNAFIAHRKERRRAILQRLREGDRTIPELVTAIYVGLADNLRAAAGRSVLAHLIELVAAGKVACEGEPGLETHYRLR